MIQLLVWLGGILAQFIEVWGHLFMHSSLVPHFSRVDVWTLCNTLILFCFRRPVVDLLVFSWSLSCCMHAEKLARSSFRCRTLKSFDSRILWYTEKFMVDSMTAKFSGSVVTKQAKNHKPSISMMDNWYEVFVVICCV